ncbi:MAG TPA: DUF234 domain-containing protein, partial [Candidatus Lokiarchaeia archaeon]
YKSNLEIRETKIPEENLKQNFNNFIGRRFEKLIREEILQRLDIMKPQKIGRWWGHYKDKETNNRKEIEIDIVMLNETSKEILFGECKWKNNVDSSQLLKDLKEKTKYFELTNKQKIYEKYYVILAKSFKKKSIENNVFYLDLNDLERLIG